LTAVVDTSIVFGFYSIRDKYHLDSVAILFHVAKGVWGKVFITNHLLDEIVNVLKYRVSPDTARDFIEKFIGKGIICVEHVSRDLEQEALELFKENIYRKGFSYTDAVTIVFMREYGIDYLLTHDLRSFHGFIENIVGPGYWNSLSSSEKRLIIRLLKGSYGEI